MEWTKRKPKEPGWYWTKHPRWNTRLAMILKIEQNKFPLGEKGEKEGDLILKLASGDSWLRDSAHVELETGKGYNSQLRDVIIEDIDEWIWAGPIEEPGEAVTKYKDRYCQTLNPKTGHYLKIDRKNGTIVSFKKSSGPYKNIPFVEHSLKEEEV